MVNRKTYYGEWDMLIKINWFNELNVFVYPNHSYCVAETGYLADKAGPSAPDRMYIILGSRMAGGAF